MGVEVVEDDHEAEAREPGGVRLPLEPEQWLGELLRSELVLLDVVEAAAVDLPCLAGDTLVGVMRILRRPQVVVERDEVEGRADPRDRRDHVQPAEEEIAPVPPVVGDG